MKSPVFPRNALLMIILALSILCRRQRFGHLTIAFRIYWYVVHLFKQALHTLISKCECHIFNSADIRCQGYETLTQLQVLDISNNRITSLPSLQCLTRLQVPPHPPTHPHTHPPTL